MEGHARVNGSLVEASALKKIPLPRYFLCVHSSLDGDARDRFRLTAVTHQRRLRGTRFARRSHVLRDVAETANSLSHVQASSDAFRPVGNPAFTRSMPRMNCCAAIQASEPVFSLGNNASTRTNSSSRLKNGSRLRGSR